MDETIITWNVTNWITVVLMVVLMWLLFAVASQAVRSWKNTASDNAA